MIAQPELCFVQFTHPGAEHGLCKTDIKNQNLLKSWNYGSHKRKFMVASGNVVVADTKCVRREEKIYFWGEWEPDSKVKVLKGYSPRFLHSPFLKLCGSKIACPPNINTKKQIRQNTDPFVFGESFYYSCCKQLHTSKYYIKSPCFMQYLKRGSVILFGSTKNQNTSQACFVLDTVFVVGESRIYHPCSVAQDLNGFIPANYEEIMNFSSWDNPQSQFVCYKGADFYTQVEDMYSFVPCKIGNSAELGYERPVIPASMLNNLKITNQNIMNDNLNSTPKKTILLDSCQAKIIWDIIRKIIHDQGYDEAIRLNYTLSKS